MESILVISFRLNSNPRRCTALSLFFKKGNGIREVKSVAHYHTAGMNQDSNSILSDSKAHTQIFHETWGTKGWFLESRPGKGLWRPLSGPAPSVVEKGGDSLSPTACQAEGDLGLRLPARRLGWTGRCVSEECTGPGHGSPTRLPTRAGRHPKGSQPPNPLSSGLQPRVPERPPPQPPTLGNRKSAIIDDPFGEQNVTGIHLPAQSS